MVRLLRRSASTFDAAHVAGHNADPWNELADTLATLVAMELFVFQPFLPSSWRESLPSRHDLAWAWLDLVVDPYERSQYPPTGGVNLPPPQAPRLRLACLTPPGDLHHSGT